MVDVTGAVGRACQPFYRAEKWQKLFLTGMTWGMHSGEELFELDLWRLWISIGRDEGRGLFSSAYRALTYPLGWLMYLEEK